MTYSRPGIRQTNANPGAPNTDPVRIRNRPSVQFGKGPSYSDRFVDSGLAGRNAGQDAAAIGKFLQDIQEPIVKFGEQLDIANANRQVGELLDQTPNLGELVRESDPDTRNRIRALSGRARDMLYSNLAEQGAVEFAEGYSNQAQSSPILLDPNSSEEARTAERTRIRQENFEVFEGLPPGYIGAVGAELSQVEGQVSGNLTKLRDATEARRRDDRESAAIGKQWVKFSAGLDATAGFETDSENGQVVGQATQFIQGQIREAYASGEKLPQGVFGWVLRGVGDQNADLIARGEFDQAESNLALLRAVSKRKLNVGDNETDFWSLSLKGANGRTVSLETWLLSQDKAIETARRNNRQKEVGKELAQLGSQLLSPDPAVRAAAALQLRTRAGELISQGDWETARPLLEAVGGLEATGRKPTEQQSLRLAQLVVSPEYLGLDAAGKARYLQQLANRGEITIEQQATATAAINQPQTQLDNELQNASTRLSQQGKLAPLVTKLTQARTAAGATNVKAENVLSEVRAAAWQATQVQVTQLRENGEAVTPERVTELFEQNAAAFVDKKVEEIEKTNSAQTQRANATNDQVVEFLKNRQNGKEKLDSIPQSLIAEWKSLNPGKTPTYRGMFDYLVAKMTKTGVQGWGNENEVNAWLRNAVRQKRTSLPAKAEEGWRDPTEGTEWTDPPVLPQQEPINMTDAEWEALPPWNRGPVRPSVQRERQRYLQEQERQRNGGGENKEQAEATDENGVAKVALAVLGGFLGGGSANAGTLDGKDVPIANEEQMATLKSLWESRQQPTLTVPALPQLEPDAPVQPVSAAMTSVNHPFAIAIGIAEGTRTASGGFTVNYYGHADPLQGQNIGTFSAQQGQATPQQADREWLGKLTRTQLAMAPVLERSGLQPGTQGYNRLMFNLLDLRVQSPLAFQGLVIKIPQIISQGTTIESIAKARADSFFDPSTGRLDTNFKSYSDLYADQRSRSGVWDYRRRI